ncbi:MAG: hypothetical protein CVU73_05350 [Deltaproteobacteria bacterium HGW-Deltaproteobacteria-8]|jgi:hypothetical protein|nr:MAG: hypothetical protein CVU73_05350 [Deltaproteobacteria bacterium HGW-Deltaproteobacteria-8]
MNKRIVLLALLFSFVCVAGPARSGLKTDVRRHVAALERNVAVQGPPALRPGTALARGELDTWLARLSGFLDRVKSQESALAEMLDSNRPEDVRECEKRLARNREALPISRKV